MLKKLLPLVLLFAGFQATAGIIKVGSGAETLEWLKTKRTLGLSRNEVANLFATNSLYTGYQIASADQVEWLLNSY